MNPADGGLALLTSSEAAGLLASVVAEHGWTMLDWRPEHVDHDPGRSTTATYAVDVRTSTRERTVLIGLTVRAQGPSKRDAKGATFVRDGVRATAWIYPDDPELAGLPAITYPSRVAEVLAKNHLGEVRADDVELRMISYRPRRRAVVRVAVGERIWYAKAFRAGLAEASAAKHRLLRTAGLPAARVAAVEADDVLLTDALPGRSLARAIFDADAPIGAEAIVDLLDGLPAAVTEFPRRAAWSSALGHYAGLVAANLPGEADRLARLAEVIKADLDPTPGDEPCHGDLHEGQLQVAGGRIVGLLDIDGVGPGRRVDDLACLLGHLSSIQRMDGRQSARVRALLDEWLPVFDERVDPAQLRLGAAAVVISLATGPYRGQEDDWAGETSRLLDVAEGLHRAAGSM